MLLIGVFAAVALVLATVGVGLALAAGRALSSMLFDLSPGDPATLAAVAALLATIALLASYFPARRATRIDPVTALRAE